MNLLYCRRACNYWDLICFSKKPAHARTAALSTVALIVKLTFRKHWAFFFHRVENSFAVTIRSAFLVHLQRLLCLICSTQTHGRLDTTRTMYTINRTLHLRHLQYDIWSPLYGVQTDHFCDQDNLEPILLNHLLPALQYFCTVCT